MKKVYSLIILILFLIVLTSCKQEFMFSSEMIINNIELPKDVVQINQLEVTNFDNYTIEDKYLKDGVIVVQDSNNKIGCWSLYINDFIFTPEEDITIDVLNKMGMTYVLKRNNADNMAILYDVFGGVALPKREYVTVNPGLVYEIDYLGKFIGTNNVEFILFTYIDDNGGIIEKSIYNQLDPKTRTRVEIKEENDKYDGSLNKQDLDEYGLNGYYMQTLDNTYYIYKNDGKLVKRIHIPNSNFLGIVNGKLIYQNKYVVAGASDEYTYFVDSEKYKLETYSVDILSGKTKKLNLNYEFVSINPYKSISNTSDLGYASIYKIEGFNKHTLKTNVIIDNEGNILYDSGNMNLLKLIRINDQRFYDTSTKYVFNEKMEPTFMLLDMQQIVYEEGWIVTIQDGYFGIIDGDGNVIIPFEYTEIYNGFMNKKTIGKHRDGNMYIIGPNEKVMVNDCRIITKGLIFKEIYDENNDVYVGRFIDYNNTVIKELSYLNSLVITLDSTNIYGSYIFIEFEESENEYNFISIYKG